MLLCLLLYPLVFTVVSSNGDISTSITMPDNETVVQMKFTVKNDNKDAHIDQKNLDVK